MKKLGLLVSLMCAALAMQAATRSVSEAAAMASQFIHRQNPVAMAKVASVEPQLCYTQYMLNENAPALYVFNLGDNGFVMISAEDGIENVVAYSFESSFPTADIPSNLQFWMNRYASEIETLRLHPADVTVRQTETFSPIGPLVTCTWSQSDPYNLKCPLDANGQRSVTGCVATAASQIMYFHKYPQTGEGEFSYEWTNSVGVKTTISEDFSLATFDWDNMQDSYYSASAAAKNAVANLMYYAGVAGQMQYGYDASGTQSEYMLQGFHRNFRYDKSLRVISLEHYNDTGFINLIYHELSHNRPVYMAGSTVEQEGHAFVCDGIDVDGRLRINWGWGGMSNGYFALRNLDPGEQGTGGSSSDLAFTEDIEIGIGIRPDEGGDYAPSVNTDKLYLTKTTDISEPFKMTVGSYLINHGACDVDGYIALVLYKDGKLLRALETLKFKLALMEGTENDVEFEHWLDDDKLEDGTYQVTIAVSNDGKTYFPLHCGDIGIGMCDVTITGSRVQMDKIKSAPSYLDLTPQAVPAALGDLQAETQAEKVMIDGKLYIMRNGNCYDALGRQLN
ncbi:MAG: C10 family peptidase [Paludibacteraceae bacterium]|nr:C10 family peptidase [Paludibacteraceae bacterium]